MYKNYLVAILLLFTFFAKAQVDFQKSNFNTSSALESSFTTVINGEKMLNIFSYDFNKDGILDIAIDGGMKYPQSFQFNPSSNIIIMLGKGDGTFTQSTTFINYVSGGINNLIAASDFADYNKDGNVDMLIYSFWDNGFYLFDGNSNGFLTFNNPKFFPCSIHGYEAFFIDYDKDGDLDIVSACSGSHAPLKLHVFDNHNNQFTHAAYGIDNRIGYSIHLKQGDVNGDGRMDFLMPIGGGYTLAIQNEDKTFTIKASGPEVFPTDMDRRTFSHYKILTDVNHDGFDDVVAYKRNIFKFVADYSSGTDEFYDVAYVDNETSKIDNFNGWLYLYGTFFHNHDMDKDGNTDIVFVENAGPELKSLVIALDPFNADGNFEVKKVPISVNCYTETGRGMLFKDFDNNGLDDICFLGSDNKIRVVLTKSSIASVSHITYDNNIKVYLNPSEGVLYLDNAVELNKFKNIKISNVVNQVVYQEANPSNHQINLNDLPTGMYMVYIQLENQILTKKIVIK